MNNIDATVFLRGHSVVPKLRASLYKQNVIIFQILFSPECVCSRAVTYALTNQHSDGAREGTMWLLCFIIV